MFRLGRNRRVHTAVARKKSLSLYLSVSTVEKKGSQVNAPTSMLKKSRQGVKSKCLSLRLVREDLGMPIEFDARASDVPAQDTLGLFTVSLLDGFE